MILHEAVIPIYEQPEPDGNDKNTDKPSEKEVDDISEAVEAMEITQDIASSVCPNMWYSGNKLLANGEVDCFICQYYFTLFKRKDETLMIIPYTNSELVQALNRHCEYYFEENAETCPGRLWHKPKMPEIKEFPSIEDCEIAMPESVTEQNRQLLEIFREMLAIGGTEFAQFTEDAVRSELEKLKQKQEADERFPCPRCGNDCMDSKPTRNALSRQVSVYVCDKCGMDEALLAATGRPFPPLTEWAVTAFFMGNNYFIRR